MGHAIVSGGAMASVPAVGIRLGDIAEGSIVKLNENGSPVEFYVAKHDYESALNGAGRTLLVRKNCYDTRTWHSSDVNAYASSTISTWLNNGYKNLHDISAQQAMNTSKFYYTPGNGSNRVTTLERSVFLLSIAELNKYTVSIGYANKEGSALPIATVLQIAYNNGSSVTQWTRSPQTNNNYSACFVSQNGDLGTWECSKSKVMMSRPCFTFPSGALFDEETMLFSGKVAS